MASSSFTESNWSNYFEVTSDNTLTDEAVGDSVYSTDIHSAPPSGFWSTVQSDGSDVRVVNSAGDTAYSFEIEEIDTSGENFTVFWDSQNLATSSDTTWRIYYGNSSASAPAEGDTLGKHNVWDANDAMKQKLNEDPSGTAPQIIDSTSNSEDGTTNGSMTSDDLVNGQIGGALDFDGSDDYIAITDSANLDVQSDNTFSVSGWFKSTESALNTLIAKWNDSSQEGWLIWQNDSDGDAGYEFNFLQKDSNGNTLDIYADSSYDDNTLHHFVVSKSGSAAADVDIYIDGAAQTTSNDNDGNPAGESNDQDLILGRKGNKDGNYWKGLTDNIRLRDDSVSANWASTHYNQQSNSSYWTVSGEKTVGGGSRKRIIIA